VNDHDVKKKYFQGKGIIDYVTGVYISPGVMESFRVVIDESSALQKELGGFACYEVNGKNITIKNVFQTRPSFLKDSSFSFSRVAMKDAFKAHCNGTVPLIFHTHPDGIPEPSNQDRLVSNLTGSAGCVASRGGLRCYLGSKNIRYRGINKT
jgi:proteasome lid subunit RPN8/RPN11